MQLLCKEVERTLLTRTRQADLVCVDSVVQYCGRVCLSILLLVRRHNGCRLAGMSIYSRSTEPCSACRSCVAHYHCQRTLRMLPTQALLHSLLLYRALTAVFKEPSFCCMPPPPHHVNAPDSLTSQYAGHHCCYRRLFCTRVRIVGSSCRELSLSWQ